jgi:class 3 adenylate cyclase
VNTAVRVCAIAEAGRVLVTDVIAQLAQGRFELSGGQAHELKGISAPVHLHDFAWEHAGRE